VLPCTSTPGRHDLGATPEARIQSFRILLTPLAYVPVGHIDIETCNSCGDHAYHLKRYAHF
jgi:hypothetical protein